MDLDGLVFTGALQEDGLAETSSVTVKELNAPSLNCGFARGGANQPSGCCGVDGRPRSRCSPSRCRPEQKADSAAVLRGQLQATGFDPREARGRGDHGAHPFASQAL